jgi:hypothetical protein
MVAASALAPYQGCRAAYLIKDAIIIIREISRLSSQIRTQKDEAYKNSRQKKLLYDTAWISNFDSFPEFWSFEYIIETFKVI